MTCRPRFLFIFGIALLVPRAAWSTRPCPALLGDESHFEKTVSRLSGLYEVSVVASEDVESNPTDFAYSGGGYRPNAREVDLAPFEDVLLRQWAVHHEAGHVGTDVRFRKADPSDRAAAFAIVILNKTADIDARLPEAYRRAFQIDEMKGYRKSHRYMSAITRLQYARMNPWARFYELIGEDQATKGAVFAEVTENVLRQTIEILERDWASLEEDIEVFLYSADSRAHFRIKIDLINADQSITQVSIPFYDAKALTDGGIEVSPSKLMAILREGVKLAERYRRP